MKKSGLALLCLIIILLSSVPGYAAEPMVGQWSAMGGDCVIEMTFASNKTGTLWAGCWMNEYGCYLYGSFPMEWRKIDTGSYYNSWSDQADIFFVKGTIATNYSNITWLKMPLKQVKEIIIASSCYTSQQAYLNAVPGLQNNSQFNEKMLQMVGGFPVLK